MPRSKKRERMIGIIQSNRWSDPRVASHFNVSQQIVGRIRKQFGLPKVEFPSLTPVKVKRILSLREQGLTLDAISKSTGISLSTIWVVTSMPKKEEKK